MGCFVLGGVRGAGRVDAPGSVVMEIKKKAQSRSFAR